MSTQRLTRKVRTVDKTRSSSSNSISHPDHLIEPILSMISSTFSLHHRTPYQIKSESDLHVSEESSVKKGLLEENEGKSKFFKKKTQRKKSELSEENLHRHPFRNLIFSPEISLDKFKDHLSLIQRGLIYSKACLKQPSSVYLKNKFINLSEKKRKIRKKSFFDFFWIFGKRLCENTAF